MVHLCNILSSHIVNSDLSALGIGKVNIHLQLSAVLCKIPKQTAKALACRISTGRISFVMSVKKKHDDGNRWIPHKKASDAGLWFFFDRRLNKRLSKQSSGWWLEMPPRSLWPHRNDIKGVYYLTRHVSTDFYVWHRISKFSKMYLSL